MSQPHAHVPYRRAQQVTAAVLAVLCLVGIAMLFRGGGSPKGWLLRQYQQEAHDTTTESYTLVSAKGVTQTADDIRESWKPAKEIVDPTGVFLRYHDLVVAVRPRPAGGSWVHVDDEEHGYTRWFGYVGGDWGTGSPAGGVRGGGPGAGK